MRTLSVYVFERPYAHWAGPFRARHIEHGTADGQWAWAQFSNIDEQAVLVRSRPPNERLWRVHETLNSSFVLDPVDASLPDEVTRTGPLRVTYAISAQASLQGVLVLIVTIPVAITTPWFCFDTTGEIRYFVTLSLDASGSLSADVSGADATLHGWTGVCQGQVAAALSAGATGGIAGMQDAFDLFAGIANINAPFHTLYFLPGSAPTSGDEDANADFQVTVVTVN